MEKLCPKCSKELTTTEITISQCGKCKLDFSPEIYPIKKERIIKFISELMSFINKVFKVSSCEFHRSSMKDELELIIVMSDGLRQSRLVSILQIKEMEDGDLKYFAAAIIDDLVWTKLNS